WGLYFNLYKKFALNYDALSMMCYIIWLGTLPLLFYSGHLSSEILHATWQANMSVVLLGIFPSAMAYVLWGYVLKNMPLTIASNFLYCSPIVAMSLAVVFLNEKPSIIVLLGGVIIVGSLVWMNWKR
ncbi:DMT family transporter, partial [Acinetobacter baumannii]